MNFLKRFLGGQGGSEELALLPSGQLFLRRQPGSPKSSSECLYTDAVASVRESSVAHCYQLVVQRAVQEGEEQLRGDEDEDGDDGEQLDVLQDAKVVLIDESLKIHTVNKSGVSSVIWTNPDDDEGEHYEFVVDEQIKASDVDSFMHTIYCCEFERKYSKSSIGATPQQLAEFVYDPEREVEESLLDLRGGHTSAPAESELAANPELAVEPELAANPELAAKPADDEPDDDDSIFQDAEESVSLQDGTPVVAVGAELRVYDPDTESFTLKDTKVEAQVYDLGDWRYSLVVSAGAGKPGSTAAVLQTLVTSDLNPVFNYEVLAFIFNSQDLDGVLSSYLLRFSSAQDLLQFQTGYMKAVYESKNRVRWNESDLEQKYVLDAFNSEERAHESEEDEADSEESDSEHEESETGRAGLRKTSFSDSDDDDRNGNFNRLPDHNNNLTIAYKNNRSYVSRGDKIGVFKTTEEDELEFTTAIENLSINNKSFRPAKMMLHTEDRSLVMQDEHNKDTLYKMDIERGKIVEEWKIQEDLPVVEIGPSKKFNQMTSEQTFIGISKKGLFKIDPRVSGDKLVQDESKLYQVKNDFSSFGVTENGYIAVGSNKGDIRLYDRLGIRAKSLIPAIGDAIKHVDVSADGKWLLATCSTYLILIDTTLKKGANSGSSAFKKSFGKDNNPSCKTLKISPEHVQSIFNLTGLKLNFTKAYFNTGLHSKETTIVTSTGPYAITWSLKKVLRGDANPYFIKRYSSDIIADNFKFGTDKNVIITLADDVGITTKKSFRKPDRQSLAFTSHR